MRNWAMLMYIFLVVEVLYMLQIGREMSLQLLADSRLVEKKTSTAEQAPANVSNDGM